MSETLIRMPKLADTLVEGTLGQWLKQVGDRVERGEPLASIETDKVTTELTSPAAGTLLETLVGEGQTVAVETPIARIGAAEAVEASSPQTGVTPQAAPPPPATTQALPTPAAKTPAPPPPATSPAPKQTPVAARLLADHGLDPRTVRVTSGRLTKQDVLDHLAAAATSTPLSAMRRAIADHMLAAYQTIPHGQTVMAADLTGLVAWREAHKGAFQQVEGAPLTFTVLFVRALAVQLAGRTQTHVDIGVAVALDDGLIVPVVRQADTLDQGATARAVADLAARARARQLLPGETQGAAMTVTNVGSFGNLTAAPIIPLGQVGILAPGLVERRPMPTSDGGVRAGWRCLLALMFHRRWLDDFAADRFLRAIVNALTAEPTLA